MQLFQHSSQKDGREKRIGRGGKRGTTSGRGTKGQRSRSGHRIRPAERDLLIRLPKLRGYRNKPIREKARGFNVGDLALRKETEFSKKNLGNAKILGGGELTKAIKVTGLPVSQSAKAKIEKAGGSVTA
ncbi:MAG: uL15 family ribosomal protein [Patescibacteria group bacterium]|nr:uL15 family ribosomal protein [Patescibacteria group bacterium]